MYGRPPQPLRQTSTTSFYFDSSNSLRNLGTHPAPADATVSERAQSSMGEHLIEAFFPFFLVYFAVFVCSFLSYLGVLVWSSQKFDWGRDLPSECAGSYSTWWFIFLPLVIFNFTGGEFIKYKLGHRRGEPILPAVKKFMALQGLVGVFLFISGLIMAQSTSALECKAASPSHYTSWLVTLSLGIVVNVMLWGGLGVFTWMSRVMARNGMLTNGKHAAPDGTVSGLVTVSVAEAAEDECSICLEAFEAGAGVVKRTPCGHSFHEACLNNWFKCARTCPNCRVDVVQAREGGWGV